MPLNKILKFPIVSSSAKSADKLQQVLDPEQQFSGPAHGSGHIRLQDITIVAQVTIDQKYVVGIDPGVLDLAEAAGTELGPAALAVPIINFFCAVFEGGYDFELDPGARPSLTEAPDPDQGLVAGFPGLLVQPP
jgi:hypothetical protein